MLFSWSTFLGTIVNDISDALYVIFLGVMYLVFID